LNVSDANTDQLTKELSDNLFHESLGSLVSVTSKWITDLYVLSMLSISRTFYFYGPALVSIALQVCIREIDVQDRNIIWNWN